MQQKFSHTAYYKKLETSMNGWVNQSALSKLVTLSVDILVSVTENGPIVSIIRPTPKRYVNLCLIFNK